MHFADQALLIAKQSGRDRVVIFGELDAPLRHRLWRLYTQMPWTPGQDDAPNVTEPRAEASGFPSVPSRG